MTAPTHITFAEFIYLLILTTTGVALNVWNALAIAAASLLPDLDTGASTIGKMFPFISTRIERRFGHRTLTHSSLFTVLYSLALLPLAFLSGDIYVCLCAGYLTHPLLDSMTVNGVKLFYPFTNHRCVFPFDVNNPHRYRVQTGSKMDRALSIIFLIACVPVFYVAHQGYERFIRVAQQSIEAAVRDYNEFSRDNLVLAEIDAYDMLTKRKLKGTFEVVGALNPHTLVFRTADSRLHTLGKSFQADYVSESVLCFRGDGARVSVRTIDLSNQLISQLGTVVDTSCENFLFGELATLEKVSLPPNTKAFTPIATAGSLIKLNYATIHDIEALGLDPLYVTKGIITVRSTRTSPASNDIDSSGVPNSRPDDVVQLAYTIDPRDSLVVYKHRGDTLHEGEIFAMRILPTFFREQILLNRGKLEALRKQQAVASIDFDRRISDASMALRADFADHQLTLGLANRGYVSGQYPMKSELKLRKERRALEQLGFAREKTWRKAAADIMKLELSTQQLEAKAGMARRQSEIRSPIGGVLLQIRTMPHDARTRIIVIVRRLH